MKISTIRSAIYLSGNKYKLFEDIAPHLKGRKVLVDLFTGSGTVALNAVHNNLGFEKVIANEKVKPLHDMLDTLKYVTESFIDVAKGVDEMFPSTLKGFYDLREYYNKAPEIQPEALYCLNVRSNSNMMRWNSKGEYNMTFGKRNYFSEERLRNQGGLSQSIEFTNLDYSTAIDAIYRNHNLKDVVVYIDSPYTGTKATYNTSWTELEDKLLLNRVKGLHQDGAKIVMSNVFENRGHTNQWLIDWCEENKDLFEVHEMNISYGNSSFRKSDKKTKEVLIVSKWR